MARTKSTNTTSVVDEVKTTEVEQTEKTTTELFSAVTDEKPVETPETKPVEKTVETKAEDKPVIRGSTAIIKCAGYENKEISLPTRTIKLDEKGCCEVTKEEAERLLTIPGYELSK